MAEDDFDLDSLPDDPEPPAPEPAPDSAADMREPTPAWQSAGTSFCPECGAENPAAANHCHACGRVLDPLADAVRSTRPSRALHGTVAAVVAGVCVVAVVLAWLTDFSLQLSARTVIRFEGERPVETRVLYSSAGLLEVFGIAGAFAVAGLISALVFAGRYLREVVLGACAALLVQFGLWLYMARAAGAQVRGDLWIVGDGFVMRGPAPILLSQFLLVMLFAAIAFAFVGWVAREQITGKATCVHCHTPYSLRPTAPVRCPKCDAEQERDGVQWPWVMLVAAVNALVFALVVALLREDIGFALECDGRAISDACKAARGNGDFTIFVTSMSADNFEFWAIDKWRYLETTAALMLIAPLVLTFVVKRGSRASAGALVPINWLAGTFVVMIVLSDLGGSEVGFIFLMKMQVIALFVWSAAGLVGVLVGDKLRFRKGSAYLDELD